MEKPDIDKLLKDIGSLPPLPHAVQRLYELAGDINSNIKDMSNIISADEALTVKILRIVNSAFYGLSYNMSTVSQAVVILGFSQLRSLALSASVFGFKTKEKSSLPISRESFWRHSLAVASAARLIARHVSNADAEETFTAGLLHDVGKMIMLEHFTEKYSQVFHDTGKASFCSTEDRIVGISHVEIGKKLCEHWKIPVSLTNVVAGHHFPFSRAEVVNESNRTRIIVQVADNLARISQIGVSGNKYIDLFVLNMIGSLKITLTDMRQILLKLPEEVRNVEVLFGMPSQGTKQVLIPRSVAVNISDDHEREIIMMALLSLGWKVTVSMEEIDLVVVITDNSSLEEKKKLEENSITVCDYNKWRNENDVSEQVGFPIDSFYDWIKKQLPSFDVGEIS